MGLKHIIEKQGGMNLFKQYWNGGAFLLLPENFYYLEKTRRH